MFNWIPNTKENRIKYTQADEYYNIPPEYYSFALLHTSKSILISNDRFYDFRNFFPIEPPCTVCDSYGEIAYDLEVPNDEITHFVLLSEYEAILPNGGK